MKELSELLNSYSRERVILLKPNIVNAKGYVNPFSMEKEPSFSLPYVGCFSFTQTSTKRKYSKQVQPSESPMWNPWISYVSGITDLKLT